MFDAESKAGIEKKNKTCDGFQVVVAIISKLSQINIVDDTPGILRLSEA